MAKILLLGGGGFIGTNLARDLASNGDEVIVASPSAKLPNAPGIRAVQLALEDTAAFEQLLKEKPQTVIHLASRLLPSSGAEEFFRELEEVSIPTKKLIWTLAREDIKFVYFSSGGTVYGNVPNERAREHDQLNPVSFYGHAKVDLEIYVEYMHRAAGLRYVIFRPSNAYGPYQSADRPQGLISALFAKFVRQEPLQVWGDGSSVRDYIYVDDLTHSVVRILNSGIENMTLNVGSGCGRSLLEVVNCFETVLGARIPLDFAKPRPGDIPRIVLDVSRLARLGAWRSRSLEDGIRGYARHLGLLE